MTKIDQYIGKVFSMECLGLLRSMPSGAIDACITDPPYGTRSMYAIYDGGVQDAGQNDPAKHWAIHGPILAEIRRILRPGGVLAWAAGIAYYDFFEDWFGPNRVWSLTRFGQSRIASSHVWICQTSEQVPIRFPDRDGVIFYKPLPHLRALHPTPKPLEEMLFMVEELTTEGDIVLDPFCGSGSTLVAARRLGRRFIGCDRSEFYCQVTMQRLAEERADASPRKPMQG